MSFKLQIVLTVIWLIILFSLINRMKKKSLDIKYTLAWLLLDVVLLVITWIPNLLGKVTKGLGIETPANMLFFFGFIFTLIVIYTLTVSLSHMSNRVRELSQKIALDEYKNQNKPGKEE